MKTEPTCQEGSYLPHPSDCAKFTRCIGGKKVEQQCPGGLKYDQANQRCDWPTNVKCSNGNRKQSTKFF